MQFRMFQTDEALSWFWRFGLTVAVAVTFITVGTAAAETPQDPPSTYTVIKDFFPAVVALVGLGGIALAARLNFFHNRRLDKERRLADAKALAIIMLSEIASIQPIIDRRLASTRRELRPSTVLLEKHDLLGLKPPECHVYRERIGDIGILEPSAAVMLGRLHGIHLTTVEEQLLDIKFDIESRNRILECYEESRKTALQMEDSADKKKLLDAIDNHTKRVKENDEARESLKFVADFYDLALMQISPLKTSLGRFAGFTIDEINRYYNIMRVD